MIEPLRISFTVRCRPEHAFDVWTRRTSLWWPHGHSFSGAEGLEVTFEPVVGGRIFERTPDGIEHDWGEVLTWQPPVRLRYRWHLATDPEHATEVEVSFSAHRSGTRVSIEHRGWDRLGEEGAAWRDRNRAGWDGVLPSYRALADREELLADR